MLELINKLLIIKNNKISLKIKQDGTKQDGTTHSTHTTHRTE